MGLAGGGERRMMGLAKMTPGGWAYYAKEIAAGAEDYFTAHMEESGRWMGRGAETLGLSGHVETEGLSRLFGHGCDPVSGAVLGHCFGSDGRAVAGYALSFSPPKSVSILWALAPGEVASRVREGHDAAVAAALDFLQDHAAFTRRGHGGLIQERTTGFVAAGFVHRTSRAGDPQLHTHVLVANKVRAVSDGRWLAIDGRELYEVQKAAGMLYKAALRVELSARLGVGWGEVDPDGGAEIVGVPDPLIRLFSKRRVQVEAFAARLVGEKEALLGRSLTGDERAATYQLAAYQTRTSKAEGGETTAQLRDRWRAEAAAGAMPAEGWLGEVFARQGVHQDQAMRGGLGLASSLDLMVAQVIDSIERDHSTWGRAQVVESLTVVLPGRSIDSADMLRRAVEAGADVVLAHPDMVLLTCLDRADLRHGGRRYSTWWTLRTEQAILDTVENGRGASVAVVVPDVVESLVSGLEPDQAGAVRRLCGSGERVAVMVGPAGSGKTASLAAARQAWQAAGVAVRGVAPSAVAAGVLSEQAAIPSDTLAKFLHQVANGQVNLKRGEVIVCDEASMISTRDLAALVLLAESAEAKVVLVGDHHQLGAVQAGGLFRLLAFDANAVELTGVRRFTDPWEAEATLRLRAGDRSVIGEYIDQGRVRSGEGDQVLDTAHQAWLEARAAGRSVMVMATDHDTVDQLALRARAARVAAGLVEPDGLVVGVQTVGVGDEIVTTGNDRRLVTTAGGWVRNGDRWQITARGPSRSLELASLHGRGQVTLPGSYVGQHVTLAYAVTVHKAQGVTVDQGVLVVDPSTSAEHLYVGMTRGRHHNLACVNIEPRGDEHQHREPRTASHVLAAALQPSSSEIPATQTLRDELDHTARSSGLCATIIDGLGRSRRHSLDHPARQGSQLQASTPWSDTRAPKTSGTSPDL
jgi:conjugative relaxase-like TrwC/TraI family protein